MSPVLKRENKKIRLHPHDSSYRGPYDLFPLASVADFLMEPAEYCLCAMRIAQKEVCLQSLINA